MSVGVLLVTHERLGRVLLDCLRDLLGELPLAADALDVCRLRPHEQLMDQGMALIRGLDTGAGVLLLTDAFGATPSNIANRLAAHSRAPVVAGVNLPMLVRAFNYPQAALDEMARIAVEGGQRGVVLCPGS